MGACLGPPFATAISSPAAETVFLFGEGRSAVDDLRACTTLRPWFRWVYSTLAQCTACCTSPTATGVVLRAEVSGYIDRKTLHFVNDTKFSLTLSPRERRHSRVVHTAR
jgi:hypothetical protein